jgi:hypothetical protein
MPQKNTLFHSKTARLAALFFLLTTGSPSYPQDDRWFKVELLIFSHESIAGAVSEAWDPSPELDYPEEFRFLIEPGELEANLEKYDATGTLNEFGRQLLVVNTPLLDEDGNPLPPSSDDAISGIPVQQTEDAVREEIEAVELPLTPTPFTALTGGEMEFRGKAAYMQRTGRYQILFHESWVQPVASEELALPIVLDRSGDTGEWPRLQGSVKLYLSRFLHIQTDLWLNTMGTYFPGSWQIPPAPVSPQSLIIEYPELPELLAEELLEPDDGPIDGGPVYPWRHAVQLQQKRKMRSTEVHYIDHPMLGVVVLVSPITDEELEAMAAAEFTPDE